jgi:hypothetical protein
MLCSPLITRGLKANNIPQIDVYFQQTYLNIPAIYRDGSACYAQYSSIYPHLF